VDSVDSADGEISVDGLVNAVPGPSVGRSEEKFGSAADRTDDSRLRRG